MTYDIDSVPKWAVRLDARRSTSNFNDLLRIVSSYFELYEKGARFLTPWISRRSSSNLPFMPPDKEEIKASIGKPRSTIHTAMYYNFVNELYNFADRTKGKRALIQPHQTTHHHAQFASGTFSITPVKTAKGMKYAINLFGADEPLYVEGLKLNLEQVKFIIVRPKLGKLGTSSVINWEVLFYTSPHNYLIDHVDSNLNPSYAGRF